jgi:hypothetical protein
LAARSSDLLPTALAAKASSSRHFELLLLLLLLHDPLIAPPWLYSQTPSLYLTFDPAI